MHEVRTWHNVALQDEDLFEQTRNFESVSFQNSTGAVDTVGLTNKANFSSLSAHYKLRENVVASIKLQKQFYSDPSRLQYERQMLSVESKRVDQINRLEKSSFLPLIFYWVKVWRVWR